MTTTIKFSITSSPTTIDLIDFIIENQLQIIDQNPSTHDIEIFANIPTNLVDTFFEYNSILDPSIITS